MHPGDFSTLCAPPPQSIRCATLFSCGNLSGASAREELRVQVAHGLGNIIFLDYEADVNFRRTLGNHADVYVGLRNCVEYASRYARFAVNVFTDQANDRLAIFAGQIGDLLKF